MTTTAFLAVAAATAPLLALAQAQEFPDTENGLRLLKIFRGGRRVRMQQLRKGDFFEVEGFDGNRQNLRAASDPFQTEPCQDGRRSWTICTAVPSAVEAWNRFYSA